MGLVQAASDINYLNESATFLINATTLNDTQVGNYSDAAGRETEDNLAETIVMIVTTVLLGLMILITVIGECDRSKNIY